MSPTVKNRCFQFGPKKRFHRGLLLKAISQEAELVKRDWIDKKRRSRVTKNCFITDSSSNFHSRLQYDNLESIKSKTAFKTKAWARKHNLELNCLPKMDSQMFKNTNQQTKKSSRESTINLIKKKLIARWRYLKSVQTVYGHRPIYPFVQVNPIRVKSKKNTQRGTKGRFQSLLLGNNYFKYLELTNTTFR